MSDINTNNPAMRLSKVQNTVANEYECANQLGKLIDQVAGRANGQVQPYDTFSNLPLDNAFFTTSVLGMQAISHVIEDKVMELEVKPNPETRFYSAFQKFSRMKPQISRYHRLTSRHIPINVFGVADAPLWEDSYLHPVILSESNGERIALSQFWFVVLHDPKFVSMALLGRELASGWPTRFSDRVIFRNFEGFWTYDNQIINQIVAILDSCIAAKA